jgi:hypothetical protein
VRVFKGLSALIAAIGAYALSGCVKIPVRDGVAAADVSAVIRRIKCDLSEVVLRKAYSFDQYGEQPFLVLRSWAAKVHMTLIVDDTGQISPGALYTTPLHAVNGVLQSFSLGVGGGLTTQVQRQEDVEFLLSFKDIDKQHHDGELYTPLYHYCVPEPGLFLESDLGLQRFVDAALKPVEMRILVPGNNIGPNVGPPTAIPRSDYSPLTAELSKPVDRKAVPTLTIKQIADKLPKNAAISQQLMSQFKLAPKIAEMAPEELAEQSPDAKGRAEGIKKLLANSVDATVVETKTQAIINDIVKPRYAIAQASLDKSCLGPITEAQYEAIAQSANVSSFVVKVDQAADKAAAPGSTDATLKRALDDSANALDSANKARDALIKQTNLMATKMSSCTQVTRRIKAAEKKAGPPVYDPISTISETVNFYVTATGSATPTWKLVQVTAPTAASFLSVTRKDTNTLILAMGRPTVGANGEAKASDAMNNQVLYSILGQALSTPRP